MTSPRRHMSHVRRHKSEHGLTFVELLLAATIISLLLAGISVQLRGGLTVWRRVTAAGERMQRLRAAWAFMERDFGGAAVLDQRPDAPWSHALDAERMVFCAIEPSGMAGEHAAWRVSYSLNHGDLIRTRQTLRQAAANQPGDEQTVLSSVARWSVQYAVLQPGESELQWTSAWPDLATLPQLIELTIDMDASAGGEQLTRVSMLPSGTLSPSTGPQR